MPSDLPLEVAARLWPEFVDYVRKYNVELAAAMSIERGEVFRLASYLEDNRPPTLEEVLAEDEDEFPTDEDAEDGD